MAAHRLAIGRAGCSEIACRRPQAAIEVCARSRIGRHGQHEHSCLCGSGRLYARVCSSCTTSGFRLQRSGLWRCSEARFLSSTTTRVYPRHLDVGVATGCLLDDCRFPVAAPQITLMDLYRELARLASRRLARYAPAPIRPMCSSRGVAPASYDSVGMINLLHCVPGAMPEKAVAFEHARAVLAPVGWCLAQPSSARGQAYVALQQRSGSAIVAGSSSTSRTALKILTPAWRARSGSHARSIR